VNFFCHLHHILPAFLLANSDATLVLCW